MFYYHKNEGYGSFYKPCRNNCELCKNGDIPKQKIVVSVLDLPDNKIQQWILSQQMMELIIKQSTKKENILIRFFKTVSTFIKKLLKIKIKESKIINFHYNKDEDFIEIKKIK